ncbi:MAG: hypothetical protein R2932_19600 [Caldilineaceae bacterium]
MTNYTSLFWSAVEPISKRQQAQQAIVTLLEGNSLARQEIIDHIVTQKSL